MLDISRNTAGMVNLGRNLMDEAVKRAKDGDLSTQELTELREIAASEGGVTGAEEVFLQDLADQGGSRSFVHDVTQAEFDPNNFKFITDGNAKVKSATGKDISLEFTDSPSASKRVKGDIAEARRTMLEMVPPAQRGAFAALNPHRPVEIKAFVDRLGLSAADKTRFLQAYMTANFNHTGKNIEWNGVSLQEGIDAVPRDNLGRAYLDCEGYAEVARTLLGDTGFSTFGVATGGPGSKRDHQVSIFRNGSDAYALSNNEMVPVPGGAGKRDAEILEAAFPGQFSDPVKDQNGAMLRDTAEFRVGEKLTDEADGAPATTTITSIDGPNSLHVRQSNAAGDSYHLRMDQDAASGQLAGTIDPQAGDVLPMGSGKITISGPNGAGVYSDAKGNHFHVTVKPEPDGKFRAEKALQSGDVLVNDDGSKLTMSSATAGRLTGNGSNYHATLSLDANQWGYSTNMAFQAGDVLSMPDNNASVTFSSPTRGQVSFTNGQASRNVSVVMQGPNQPYFNFLP